MKIKNATQKDITEIFRLYTGASDYQRSKKTVVVWPDFDHQMVAEEIAENRQFNVLINDEIACVWAITFTDEQIWEERNIDAAIYIHRIATNPKYRGHNFVSLIVDWAKEFVQPYQIRFIRLDTIGDNKRLIKHYCNAGFDFLGLFHLKNTDTLPAHYKEGPACLFQIDLEK